MNAPDPSSLVAVCVPLPAAAGPAPSVDPVVVAGDDGHLFVGRTRTVAGQGTAALLSLPRGLDDTADLRAVHAWLSAVPVRWSPAPPGGAVPPRPVVAVGALPFDRSEGATLAVPARAYCRTADGTEWLVAVVPHPGAGTPQRGEDPGACATDPAALRAWLEQRTAGGGAPAGAGPGTAPVAEVRFLPPGEGYAGAVATAVTDIAAGRLRKVVLARAVEVRFGEPAAGSDPAAGREPAAGGRSPGAPPSPTQVVRRLWGDDPAFHAFSLPVPGGRFVGASPELIVARTGTEVTSLPLAGTVALPAGDAGAADAAVARLLASGKDLGEHRLVVEAVAAGLSRHCADVAFPSAPVVVRLRSDARLGTPVRASVPPPGHALRRHVGGPDGAGPSGDGRAAEEDGCSALELLAALHPTPAVGGVERAAALAHIAALEAAPRGYWAGPVGWVDGTGDGEWVLAIRSTVLTDGSAVVHAGAGIVAGSDPQAELAETTVKLAPVLEALAPGAAALLALEHRGGPSHPSPVPPDGPSTSRP